MPAAVPVWFISLAALGALYLSAACIPLLAHLAHLALCLRRPIDLRRRYGTWAVITGPTTGLGKATAMELASRGISLVLLDLDAANLQSVSESIARTHPSIQTKTVVFDLSLVGTAAGDQSIQELREAVEGLDVGVLVNNAAVARPGAMYGARGGHGAAGEDDTGERDGAHGGDRRRASRDAAVREGRHRQRRVRVYRRRPVVPALHRLQRHETVGAYMHT
jgi:hypothetical protein